MLVVLAAAGLERRRAARLRHAGCDAAAANNEPGCAQYARKVLTDTELAAPTTDDTNNLVRLTYPDQTWASVVAGDSWAKLLTCNDYDTTTAPTPTPS